MKKTFLILLMLLTIPNLFCSEDILEISQEDIDISSMGRAEYEQSPYFSEGSTFSTGLEVYSKTSNVKIYIDSTQYSGDSIKTTLPKGTYRLTIKKTGYTTVQKWITIPEDSRIVIIVELEREYGFIKVISNSPKIITYINNVLIDEETKVPTGTYVLKVQGFGFLAQNASIRVLSNRTTSKDFVLEPAIFKIDNTKLDKSIYNPIAAEGFSQNSLKISVNGPNSSIISLVDHTGSVLYTHTLKLEDWDTTFDFSNFASLDLADGSYKIVIDTDDSIVNKDFLLDSTIFSKNLLQQRTFTGLLASPTAEMNIKETSQVSFNVISDFSNSSVSLPFSLQKTVTSTLQLNTGFNFEINFKDDSNNLGLYGGLFSSFNFDPLLLGLNLNYQFNNSQTDQGSQITNKLSVNIPITYEIYDLYLSISPEYSYIFNDEQIFGSGCGLHFDNQRYRVGVSGRADTSDFETFDLLYGMEGYMLLKNSQTFAGLSIYSNQNLDLTLALSLSTIF